MTNEEIKSQCEKMYVQIHAAEVQLVKMRELCSHDKVSVCNYSWRPGHIALADVCDFCGQLIRYK
jgi:hypothetical protein